MIIQSSSRNSSSLGEELTSATISIKTQHEKLQTMVLNVETLQERLEEVGWAIQTLNHSLSGDVILHQVKISELQETLGNVSYEATSTRITQIHLEEQMRNEIEILNVITADLRLKEWEHSMTLKNLTLLQGRVSFPFQYPQCILTAVPVSHNLVSVTSAVVLQTGIGLKAICLALDCLCGNYIESLVHCLTFSTTHFLTKSCTLAFSFTSLICISLAVYLFSYVITYIG